jgi:hypothetical protein
VAPRCVKTISAVQTPGWMTERVVLARYGRLLQGYRRPMEPWGRETAVSVCRARSMLLVTFALAIAGSLIVPLAASAAEPAFSPYGKYEGSAVSDKGGEAIAVTVYVDPADQGQVRVTFVVPRIGESLGVFGTPEQVGSAAWKIPLSVDASWLRLSGSGNLWLQPDGEFWVMRGVGSGSFRGSNGSGRGYAKQVRKDPATTEQLVEAMGAFASFKPPDAGSPEAPPQFTGEELAAAAEAAAPTGTEAGAESAQWPPWTAPVVFVVMIFLIFIAALGLFI